MSDIKTLGDELPKEIARCQELLIAYRQIGPAGNFGAAMIKQALAKAQQATMAGDVVAMIRCYEELKGLK